MTVKKFDNMAIDLSHESFNEFASEYSFDYALENGLLVNVTSWVKKEMGFAPHRYRIQVAVTARLWRDIVTISPVAKKWQSVTGRGNDLLWLAAYALEKARRVGDFECRFRCFLPTADSWDEECYPKLYAKRGKDNGRLHVVIGYAEEFTMI